ncbi:hypothetical protein FUT78_08385 [Xylella fastidiosa subsp. fastidiosa]|nr:hypothetical protein [Xylella fastidiosa subsp. fastidiosa]
MITRSCPGWSPVRLCEYVICCCVARPRSCGACCVGMADTCYCAVIRRCVGGRRDAMSMQ